jgi:hypothetical protein
MRQNPVPGKTGDTRREEYPPREACLCAGLVLVGAVIGLVRLARTRHHDLVSNGDCRAP